MRTLEFFLTVFGIAYTAGHSRLTLPLRSWIAARGKTPVLYALEGVECPACFSFHVGWVLYVVGLSPFSEWWISGFACTTVSFLLGRLTGLISDPQKG